VIIEPVAWYLKFLLNLPLVWYYVRWNNGKPYCGIYFRTCKRKREFMRYYLPESK
jgi:hypothetical protein